MPRNSNVFDDSFRKAMEAYEELQWRRKVEPAGKAYGYPACCIEAFAKATPSMINNGKLDRSDAEKRYLASMVDGQYSGFIPCIDHARAVLAGEITLDSLISGRDPSLAPFPSDWSIA